MISRKTVLRWLSHCFSMEKKQWPCENMKIPLAMCTTQICPLTAALQLVAADLSKHNQWDISCVRPETIWKRHIHAEEGEKDGSDVITIHAHKLVMMSWTIKCLNKVNNMRLNVYRKKAKCTSLVCVCVCVCMYICVFIHIFYAPG